MNRMMMEKAQRILNGVGMTHEFCVEVVDVECYLVNRSLLIALVNKNPYEAWASMKPSLTHLIVFGCHVFVHILKEKRSKLDNNLEKCIFIGYKDGVKGYKLCNLVTRKVVYSIDTIFIKVGSTSKVEYFKRKK